MAKIILGLGSSHTPMLLASDETLPRFAETDQKIKHRDKEGRPATYAELLEKSRSPDGGDGRACRADSAAK